MRMPEQCYADKSRPQIAVGSAILRTYLVAKRARHIPYRSRDDEQRCRCPGTCSCAARPSPSWVRGRNVPQSRMLSLANLALAIDFHLRHATSKHQPSPRTNLSTLPVRLGLSSNLFPNSNQTDVMRPHSQPTMTACCPYRVAYV